MKAETILDKVSEDTKLVNSFKGVPHMTHHDTSNCHVSHNKIIVQI